MNIHQQTQLIGLGVNVDHIAALRNVSGTSCPDLLQVALLAEEAGADCITLHLREDRRHIKDIDVEQIRPRLVTRLNLVTSVTQEMLDVACRIKPRDVCLVPGFRAELDTEEGLDVIKNFTQVRSAVSQLQEGGIRVSVLVDADTNQIQAVAEAGATVVEIHTGRYACANDMSNKVMELQRVRLGVLEGVRFGLKVNAGHGLHYTNVQEIAAISEISELNIGHAIVARAVFVGWFKAVSDIKAIMVSGRLSAK